MKYLTLLLLLFTGCTPAPILVVGNCYDMIFKDTKNVGQLHLFSSFKIVDIKTGKKAEKYYIIQLLDSLKPAVSALYPKADSYAYIKVSEFDLSIAKMSTQMEPGDMSSSPIKCNPINWNKKKTI